MKEVKITGLIRDVEILQNVLDLLGVLLTRIKQYKPKIERLDFGGLRLEQTKDWKLKPEMQYWDKKARYWAR